MIICVCGNFSEKRIETEIKFGCDSMTKLQKVGICNSCKSCKTEILKMLRASREENKTGEISCQEYTK